MNYTLSDKGLNRTKKMVNLVLNDRINLSKKNQIQKKQNGLKNNYNREFLIVEEENKFVLTNGLEYALNKNCYAGMYYLNNKMFYIKRQLIIKNKFNHFLVLENKIGYVDNILPDEPPKLLEPIFKIKTIDGFDHTDDCHIIAYIKYDFINNKDVFEIKQIHNKGCIHAFLFNINITYKDY